MNTIDYGGRNLRKGIGVLTNDKKNKHLKLFVSGNVKKFARISSRRILLVGLEGIPMKKTVEILPEPDIPLKILDAKALKGKNIRFALEEIPGGGYRLTVENHMAKKGRYHDRVTLRTDSKIRPWIRIDINGTVLAKPQKK